jgi:hypothetical protein
MSRLEPFLAPLVVGLGGVGLAALWFYVWAPAAVLVPIAIGLLGYLLDAVARRKLNHDDPVGAARWTNGWLLVPIAIGIAASGAAIVIAVEWNAGKDAPIEREKILAAAVASVGAFLTAAFIKNADEADEKWIGARFKKLFQAHYNPRFRPGQPTSDAEKAVRAEAALGFSGWGRAARKRRAEIVAADPPS